MWTITKAEAIEMYARFWTARYGTTASGSARRMAKSFEEKGDQKGNEAWTQVADAIERRQHEQRQARRQETVTPRSRLTS